MAVATFWTVAPRRVHHHARRLVDHEQVLVLVGDREGHRGRRSVGLPQVRGFDVHDLPGRNRMALGPDRAVDVHAAGVDQALGIRS